jgi:hypothetical protein
MQILDSYYPKKKLTASNEKHSAFPNLLEKKPVEENIDYVENIHMMNEEIN